MWSLADRRPYLVLALLALAAFLPGLFSLPPVDRDEARFAQASKQMIESGDYVDIRFQETPRHKKPIGIYWAQAGAARLVLAPPHDRIWAYRLPSLLGALMAVWLTYWAGRPLFGPRAAFIGAALLAVSVMLAAEARLAKTDALLLATIVAGMGVLARAYLLPAGGRLALPLVLVFWTALGLGILIKGPIAPLVIGLTVLALGFWDGRWRHGRALRPLVGLPVMALLVAPWFIAVGLATDGRFFAEALGGDLLPKLAGGQESHGAPPGTYLALALVTFWPGALFLGPALVRAWHDRAQPAFRFALAWALPTWLLFEVVPTKLPHYVLPAYPALALLCGAAVVLAARHVPQALGGRLGHAALATFVAAGFAFAVVLATLRLYADGSRHALDIALSAGLLSLVAVTLLVTLRGHFQRAALYAVAAGLFLSAAVFWGLAPRLEAPRLSERILALVPADAAGGRPRLIASGYAEPSLVFLAGTSTVLADPAGAAAALAGAPAAYAAVTDETLPAFLAETARLGLRLEAVGRVRGFNYSTGDWRQVSVLRQPSGLMRAEGGGP